MVEVIMIEPDITEEENNMVWMNVMRQEKSERRKSV